MWPCTQLLFENHLLLVSSAVNGETMLRFCICTLMEGESVVELLDEDPFGAGRMKKNEVQDQNVALVKSK